MSREIVEQLGGDFGVTVIYTLDEEFTAHVDFVAALIEARGLPDECPLYASAANPQEQVTDPHDAEHYIAGSVKWDGCSHLNFGDTRGYLHLCGRDHFKKLADTLTTIYHRCGQLMAARGVNLLDDEFDVQ